MDTRLKAMCLVLVVLLQGCSGEGTVSAPVTDSVTESELASDSCSERAFDFQVHVNQQRLLRTVPQEDGAYAARELPAGVGRNEAFDKFCQNCASVASKDCQIYLSY